MKSICVLSEEATSRWRKFSNEELRELCCLPDMIRVMKDEIDGAWIRYGMEVKYVHGLERKPEVPRPLQDIGLDGRAI